MAMDPHPGPQYRTTAGDRAVLPRNASPPTVPTVLPRFLAARMAHRMCSTHGVSLADRCPECGSAVLPHRLDEEAPHAATCAQPAGKILRSAEGAPSSPDALLFQEMADRAVQDGEAMCLGQRVGTRDWFETADFFASPRSPGGKAAHAVPQRTFLKTPQALNAPSVSSHQSPGHGSIVSGAVIDSQSSKGCGGS